MKAVYPIILTETSDKKIPYLVYVPDFDVSTQGKDLADALYMAEDAISLAGVDRQDESEALPTPSKANAVDVKSSPWSGDKDGGIVSETVTLVPVDFDAYRKRLKTKSVRRNVSLPAWLDAEAEKAGVNVSSILQSALKEQLGL
jgi:predicted RNase H-like HicB family nuclease